MPEHWTTIAAKRTCAAGRGGGVTKGTVACDWNGGMYPGFSASGQDVWLDEAMYEGPGIVLSAVGARCGKCFRADALWGAVANTHVLLPKAIVDRDYLWRLMDDEEFWEKGGAAQPYVQIEDSLARRILLPPLTEQRAIADFLDRETGKIDALVAKKERLIELLREKRAALITHAVTKGLDPAAPMKDSGTEWLGEMPAHWRRMRLKHLSPRIGVGVVVNPSTYVAEEGVPFLFGADIIPGRILAGQARKMSEADSRRLRDSLLRAGDLVTVRVGAPGVTAVVPPGLEGANCASVVITRRSVGFHSQWLCYAINSRVGLYQVERVQYGAAQKQFNVAHAVEFVYPTPPLTEQRAIADYLDRETAKLDALIGKVREGIALLREYRTALISAAVTGKIDVRQEGTG